LERRRGAHESRKRRWPKKTSPDRNELLTLTVEIVSAYAGNNALDTAAVPDLIGAVFAKLNELATDEKALPETLTPAVPIKKSVTDDYIVCLEDGKKLRCSGGI
jgi:predicted transcriptional regulator